MAGRTHVLAMKGRRKALIALVLSLSAATAVAFANTGNLVERAFETALQQSVPPAVQTQHVASNGAPVAGSEDFWLSPAGLAATTAQREVTLATWAAPVRLGAILTLTVAGEPMKLEVVDITDLSPPVTRVDTSSGADDLVVVTLREAGKPDAPVLRLVAGASHAPNLTTAQRAL